MSRNWCRFGGVSWITYGLVILFGVASWVDINGLFVELPILVQRLPEGWDLPSYMVVIIQIANVGPLVYTLVSAAWPHRMLEVPVIYVIIFVGGVSCLLMSFLWDVTSEVAGKEQSTALFGLQFFLALVDCTSSVAFLPFMSRFQPGYMTAYFIGEGFSGLIPSLVALGQGAGSMECVQVASNNTDNEHEFSTFNETYAITKSYSNSSSIADTLSPFNTSNVNNASLATFTAVATTEDNTLVFSSFPKYQEPRFTVGTFFLILMVLMICSLIAFTLLNFWSHCKLDTIDSDQSTKGSEETLTSRYTSDSYMIKNLMLMDSSKEEYENAPFIEKLKFDKNASSGSMDNHCSDEEGLCEAVKFYEILKDTIQTPKMPVNGGSSTRIPSFTARSISTTSSSSVGPKQPKKRMSRLKYGLYLLWTAWLNGLSNGVLPALQTYSCLPYGISAYHLSVTLANIANPVSCVATFFLAVTSVKVTGVLTGLSTLMAAFVIATAALSPDPPLVGHTAGVLLVTLSWILTVFTLTYTKVCMATEFRHQGRRALLWTGAATQAGSLCGALITFFLVNYYKLFQVANPCR